MSSAVLIRERCVCYYDPHSGRFLQEDPHPGELKTPNSITSKYSYVLNNPYKYTDASGKNPLLIAIGIGALIGGILGGVDALINGEDFMAGVIRGAMTGAVIGALVGTGNAWAAGGVVGKSLIQASLTKKGNFLSNFNEYAYNNTVPASVGAAFVGVAKGGFNLSETFGAAFTWIGVILTIKDINETACDEDNASDFARNNVCVN